MLGRISRRVEIEDGCWQSWLERMLWNAGSFSRITTFIVWLLPSLGSMETRNKKLCIRFTRSIPRGRSSMVKTQYRLHFAPGQLPPVNAFWSLTLYELPSSLLSANSINRYLLNSPMLPQFHRDADGGLTFFIQHESPGVDKEANWLPAPKGPFFLVLRLYWPKEELSMANGLLHR